jgi:hypothetical protein
MNIPDGRALLRLGDTTMVLADPAQIKDLIIDDAEKKVRFMQVAGGGFLGLGKTEFLVPVDAIAHIDPKAVHISRRREHVAATPAYDPKVIDQEYVDQVYKHYGLMPFWMMGYSYPVYPFYL